MNIGAAVKSIRNQYKLSQEELSIKSGLSQTSISQIENGIKQPSKKTIKTICSVLDVPEAVLYILGIEETDVPKSKKKIFQDLYPEIKNLASQIIGKKNSRLI